MMMVGLAMQDGEVYGEQLVDWHARFEVWVV